MAPSVITQQAFINEIETVAANLHEMAQDYRHQSDEQPTRRFRQLTLSDPAAFSYVPTKTGWGDRELQEILIEDPGAVPVYRAGGGVFGHAAPTHGNIISASESAPLISFAANGDSSAGTNFVFHDRPFYVTGDRTVLRVEDPKIDPRYVLYGLRNMKAVHGFDHTHKAVPKNLGIVSFDVPVTDAGEWDIKAQQQIVQRHQRIGKFQELLSHTMESVSSYDVDVR